MAITLTKGAGFATVTNNLELDLYAGSPDNELWQGTDYPGGLNGFQPRQTDGAAVAGLKLLCLTATSTDVTAGDPLTIQISGEATSIVSFIMGSAGTVSAPTGDFQTAVVGSLSDTAGNGLNDTLTISYETAGTGVIPATTTLWLIVA